MQPVPAAVTAWRENFILNIPCGKHAGDIGCRGIGFCNQIMFIIHVQNPLKKGCVGGMANGNEHPIKIKGGLFARFYIFKPNTGYP